MRQARRTLLSRLTQIGLLAAGLELAAACDRLPSQAPRVPRIGWVANQAPAGDPGSNEITPALVTGLGDYGYIPGQNLQLDSRFPSEDSQNADMISDLLRSGVDMLVTGGTAATQAARRATSTASIVGIQVGDPVGSGLVQSLARPGGNVTAVSNDSSEVAGKSLELLRLMVPTLSRVGFLYSPDNASWVTFWQHFSALAAASAMQALPATAPTIPDIDAAFETLVAHGAEAIYSGANQGIEGPARVATLALSHHLISMGAVNFATAGGLVGYGPDQNAMYRRAGYYVDRILKGIKPCDLPVELPTTFDLVVNQATARALGVSPPDEVAQQVTSWI